MSAIAAGVVATLTRERDEARAVARQLANRFFGSWRWAEEEDEDRDREKWERRYPWLADGEARAQPAEGQEETEGDPD